MNKISRFTYLIGACLFLAGVAAQVFLAGMVVVSHRMGWGNHIGLGHTLAGPLLIMLIAMYPGRLPRQMKWLTWLLFSVYVLQADVLIFLRSEAPIAAAFHPVLALVDFALGLALAQRAWRLAGQVETPAPAVSQFETSAPENTV